MIFGDHFTWQWITNEATPRTLNIDASKVSRFHFKNGPSLSQGRPPTHIYAYGSMRLEEAISDGDIDIIEWLKVSDSSGTYFTLKVDAINRHDDPDYSEVKLVTAGTAIRKEKGTYNIPRTPGSVTLPNLTLSGAAVRDEAGARIRGVEVVYPPDTGIPEDIESTVGRILNYLEATGLCLAVEDMNCNPPCWLLIPLPITPTSDTRSTANRRYSSANTLPMRKGTRKWRAPAWSADEMQFKTASGTQSVITTEWLTVQASSFRKEGKQERFKYRILIQPSGSASPWRHTVSGPGPTIQDVDGAVTFVPNTTERRNAQNLPSGGIRVRLFLENTQWELDTPPPAPANINNYQEEFRTQIVRRPPGDAQTRIFLANDKAEREKRFISAPEFAFNAAAANLGKLQDLIDAWDDWKPEYARQRFVIDRAGANDLIRVQAGERVELTTGGIEHYCLVAGLEWRIEDKMPLVITWHVILQQHLNFVAAPGLSLASGNGYIDVTLVAPSSSQTITHYTISWASAVDTTDKGSHKLTSGLTYRIPGLTNGESYTVMATASTAKFTTSEAVASATPAEPSPTGVQADFEFDSVNGVAGANRRIRKLGTTTTTGDTTIGTIDLSNSNIVWNYATDGAMTGDNLAHMRLRFTKTGIRDGLASAGSFYIYAESTVYEFDMSRKHTDSSPHRLYWDDYWAPAGLAAGDEIRVIFADSGQAAAVKSWIDAGN